MKNERRFVSLVLSSALLAAGPVLGADTPDRAFIAVTGEAEVKVVPDEAVIRTHIITSDRDLLLAKAQNDQRVKATLTLLADLGVKPEKVQTSSMYVSPRDWRDDKKAVVTRSLVVVLEDLKKADDVMATLVKGGVNLVDGYELRSSDLREHRDHARALAIRAAREKAVALTAAIGQTIGKAFSIEEEVPETPRGGPRPNFSQNVITSRSSSDEDSENSGSFSAGQISIRARVAVKFELP